MWVIEQCSLPRENQCKDTHSIGKSLQFYPKRLVGLLIWVVCCAFTPFRWMKHIHVMCLFKCEQQYVSDSFCCTHIHLYIVLLHLVHTSGSTRGSFKQSHSCIQYLYPMRPTNNITVFTMSHVRQLCTVDHIING